MSATSEKDEVTTPENALSKVVDDPLTKIRDLNNQSNKKEWVKFENEEEESKFNEIKLDENKVKCFDCEAREIIRLRANLFKS